TREVEADDDRRVARIRAPEPVAGSPERSPRVRELERAHDATLIVRMDGGGRGGIALGEQLVGAFCADGFVEALPVLALPGARRRWKLQRRKRSPQVEAGSTGHDRCPAGCQDLVDRLVRTLLVLGHGGFVSEVPDPDEPRRSCRL